MLELERQVHTCMKCKRTFLHEILPYPPVYSFGNPEGKSIVIIGLNPSAREYINGYLSDSPDIEQRRDSQLLYFDRRRYSFFNEIERFFEGEVKKKLGWERSLWSKVGYLDLVKCPTVSSRGQWSKLPTRHKRLLLQNCEGYLLEQLRLYQPQIIVPYGTDICKWFAQYLGIIYEDFEAEEAYLNNQKVQMLFIPQRQGPHSKPEVAWIQNKLVTILNFIS